MATDMRIGDDERQGAVDLLTTAVGDGRLDLVEFEKRSAAAYAAVRTSDLDTVLHDLPRPTPPAPKAPRVPADWAAWIAVNVLCVGIWLATCLVSTSFLYPWPIWVAGPWGVMLLAGRFGMRHGFEHHAFENHCARAISDSRSRSRS